MTSRTGFVQISDALFRTVAETTAAAVFIIARDRFQYVNPALATLAGYSTEQLLGIDPYDLIHPDSLAEALRRLPAARSSGSFSPRWELRIRTHRGDSAWLALATTTIEIGTELVVIGVGVDVTETKLAEAGGTAIPDADSASQIARGFAHDLNDLLQVIHGHADRLSEDVPAESPLSESSDGIRKAAVRAAELTQQLLMFSRQLLPRESEGIQLLPPAVRRPVVLLVEDEEPVRELIGQMLERHGFHVVLAASGEEGLRLEQENHIDLLLSDVMLPGRNGFQVASQIRQRSPNVRVIFMSGYAGETTATRAGLEPGTPFIQKPFKMADLLERIRESLGHP